MIEKYNEKIKYFAVYISDDKIKKIENSVVKKLEENLEEISIEKNNSECFTRPEWLFKSDNSIYKSSWNNY